MSLWLHRLDICDLQSKSNIKTNAKYFDIDSDGIICLKPEYRDDDSETSVNTSGVPAYPLSVSDKGIGVY